METLKTSMWFYVERASQCTNLLKFCFFINFAPSLETSSFCLFSSGSNVITTTQHSNFTLVLPTLVQTVLDDCLTIPIFHYLHHAQACININKKIEHNDLA